MHLTAWGYDAFLVDFDQLAPMVKEILENIRSETHINETSVDLI
jgi:hypothetical protein